MFAPFGLERSRDVLLPRQYCQLLGGGGKLVLFNSALDRPLHGIEAAVHAMNKAYHDNTVQAVLFVDVSNALNCLNRQADLCNIRHLCCSLATVLTNTYTGREPSNLYMDGHTILSQEGTTQGDPLAMPMYAIGICPLICKVSCDTKQVWYADDATAAGQLKNLRQWWDNLVFHGPDFGYFINPSKTSLIVKEGHQLDAIACFEKTKSRLPQMAYHWEQLWEQRNSSTGLSKTKSSGG